MANIIHIVFSLHFALFFVLAAAQNNETDYINMEDFVVEEEVAEVPLNEEDEISTTTTTASTTTTTTTTASTTTTTTTTTTTSTGFDGPSDYRDTDDGLTGEEDEEVIVEAEQVLNEDDAPAVQGYTRISFT